jgi:hypothetical protein
VRERLFKLAPQLSPAGIRIGETQSCKFNANPGDPSLKKDQVGYIERIISAKFSICPRGTGTGSFRLQESMALGRAPVIISDDWVPVTGPRFDQFAIFVKEAELEQLPRILREHEPRWREMGRLAQKAWRQFFDPRHYCLNALSQIVDISRHRQVAAPKIGPAFWDKLIAREVRRRKGPLRTRILRGLRRRLKR